MTDAKIEQCGVWARSAYGIDEATTQVSETKEKRRRIIGTVRDMDKEQGNQGYQDQEAIKAASETSIIIISPWQ